MKTPKILTLTPETISNYGVCGYKDVSKHIELQRKIDWFKKYYAKGLTINAVIADDESYQGMIEYVPGEYAHRPVDAKDYMFIHCIFTGFKKEYKNQGFGKQMIDKCINDAKEENLKGVAVVTRNGSFMAKRDIFLTKGFAIVDKAEPDFELLVLKFNKTTPDPKFKDLAQNLAKYKSGLYIFRSHQCPYTEKNVNAIIKTAKDKLKLNPILIELKDHTAVQNSPCAFGVFCIVYNGKVISHHPISNTRFENIMNAELKDS